jgi:hypothetical protein
MDQSTDKVDFSLTLDKLKRIESIKISIQHVDKIIHSLLKTTNCQYRSAPFLNFLLTFANQNAINANAHRHVIREHSKQRGRVGQ